MTLEEIGEAAAQGKLAILPVGATEQHGPHLAPAPTRCWPSAWRSPRATAPATWSCPRSRTGARSGIPTAGRARCLCRRHDDRAVGRPRPVDLRLRVSQDREVDGHATNGPPCQSAILQLRHELPDLRPRFVSIFDLTPEIAARYREDAADFHANEAETSMLLHLAPDQVRPDRFGGRARPHRRPGASVRNAVGHP